MTIEEILEEYKKIFVLIIENAGHDTKNRSYLNVENIVNREDCKSVVKDILDNGVTDLSVFIAVFISFIVLDIHGVDKLSNLSVEETHELTDSMWELYLKSPTRRFTTKNGLPIINKLNVGFFVRRFIKKED